MTEHPILLSGPMDVALSVISRQIVFSEGKRANAVEKL